MSRIDRAGYAITGRGVCKTSQGKNMPIVYKVDAKKVQLQPLCDAFLGCIAFSEGGGQDYGRLYFASVDAALAADAPRGWEKHALVSGSVCVSDCDVASAYGGGGACWTVRVPAAREIGRPHFSGYPRARLDLGVLLLLWAIVPSLDLCI